MVLAIIAASLAALLFSTAMLGIFIGGGYKNPETKVQQCELFCQLSYNQN